MGLIFSLLDVASAREVPFAILLHIEYVLHGLSMALLCVPFIFVHHEKCRFSGRHVIASIKLSVILRYFTFISASKNNCHFVLETNTGDVGGFLQVQHYWGVNKVLNLVLWMLQMISVWNWSHHVPTTKLTPFVGSKDEWDTKEDPWRMHCKYSSMAKGTSRALVMSNSKKNQARSLSHCQVTQVWRHQAVS